MAKGLSNGLIHGIRRVLTKNQTVVMIPSLASYEVHCSAQFFLIWRMEHFASKLFICVYDYT